jgi:hypothetical protein
MGKARFWAGLEMFKYVSDMTPSALGILLLGIQIILMAGEGTVGWVKRQLLVISGFSLQTNQHLVCVHPPYLIESTNLLQQDPKQFCET